MCRYVGVILAGVTTIRTVHFSELQRAVAALEEIVTIGEEE